jgi:hypothetical protein
MLTIEKRTKSEPDKFLGFENFSDPYPPPAFVDGRMCKCRKIIPDCGSHST